MDMSYYWLIFNLSLLVKEFGDENELLDNKCNQFESTFNRFEIEIKELKGRIKALDEERSLVIGCKENLEHKLKELEVFILIMNMSFPS